MDTMDKEAINTIRFSNAATTNDKLLMVDIYNMIKHDIERVMSQDMIIINYHDPIEYLHKTIKNALVSSIYNIDCERENNVQAFTYLSMFYPILEEQFNRHLLHYNSHIKPELFMQSEMISNLIVDLEKTISLVSAQNLNFIQKSQIIIVYSNIIVDLLALDYIVSPNRVQQIIGISCNCLQEVLNEKNYSKTYLTKYIQHQVFDFLIQEHQDGKFIQNNYLLGFSNKLNQDERCIFEIYLAVQVCYDHVDDEITSKIFDTIVSETGLTLEQSITLYNSIHNKFLEFSDNLDSTPKNK